MLRFYAVIQNYAESFWCQGFIILDTLPAFIKKDLGDSNVNLVLCESGLMCHLLSVDQALTNIHYVREFS